MNRDQLIEAAVLAHYNNYFAGLLDVEPAFQDQPESHQDRMREAMNAALTAIEAHGLVIVPVEATEAMLVAGALGSGEDSENVAEGAWDAMIEAGKL